MAAPFEASGARMNASGGGSILFGNTSTTNQTRNVHVQFTSTGQTNDMIPFFRQGSTNYRIPYDAAAGDHTPGTGIWFLASSEYVDWKNGEVLNMMCTGVPGAGKTVMSAAIINDLWKSHPKAVVLYVFNDATQEKLQTLQLFVLNFISQLLEQHSNGAPSNELLELYDTYKGSSATLPNRNERPPFLSKS